MAQPFPQAESDSGVAMRQGNWLVLDLLKRVLTTGLGNNSSDNVVNHVGFFHAGQSLIETLVRKDKPFMIDAQ